MDCEQLKIMFWNCRVAENIAFYRVCNIYMQEKKPYILAIMEIRSDPGKLNKDFTRLVLLGLLILIQEALRAVCYGWKVETFQIQIIKRHFQFIHSKITTNNGSE